MKIKKLLFSTLLFSISFSGFGADAGSEALAIAERVSVYIDKASFSVEKDENGHLFNYYQKYDPATGTVPGGAGITTAPELPLTFFRG